MLSSVVYIAVIIFRLSRVESELVLSEQKGKDLEILLEKERSDKEALSSSYRSELRAAGEVCSFFFNYETRSIRTQ